MGDKQKHGVKEGGRDEWETSRQKYSNKLHDLFGQMGWISAVSINEPVYSNLVRIFYSNLKHRYGGSIVSGVRGVQIELTPDDICRIFDVPTVGLELYESKTWPTVPGFDPALAVQRLCGLSEATQSGRPNVHQLTILSRVSFIIYFVINASYLEVDIEMSSSIMEFSWLIAF